MFSSKEALPYDNPLSAPSYSVSQQSLSLCFPIPSVSSVPLATDQHQNQVKKRKYLAL